MDKLKHLGHEILEAVGKDHKDQAPAPKAAPAPQAAQAPPKAAPAPQAQDATFALNMDIKTAQQKNFVSAVADDRSRARVEIDEFMGDDDMVNLFLLALESMQTEDPTKSIKNGNEDYWTWHSLAGIHGLPQNDFWCGVKEKGEYGYCEHGQTVFPSWHRVYMNAYEQAIANRMLSIAQQYTDPTDKNTYLNAASRFRIPFWDPIVPRNRVPKWEGSNINEDIWDIPKILKEPEVYVNRPGKGKDKIKNPLYQFTFPDPKTLGAKQRPIIDASRLGNVKHTLRSPSVAMKGETDISALRLKLQRQNQNMSTKLWKLLSKYGRDLKEDEINKVRTWNSFANHNAEEHNKMAPPKLTVKDKNGKPQQLPLDFTSVSVESWHDSIHVLVGSGDSTTTYGHMGDTGTAAFDPIFWLHHCNIDRITAIYQALNPNSWVPTTAVDGRSNTTNLIPFKKDDKTYWVSKDVSDWKKLGYATPGNQELDAKGQLALQTYINEYYDWATEGKYPPDSVMKQWPKDTTKAYAFTGVKAPKQKVAFEALTKSGLVHRVVRMPAQAAPPAALALAVQPGNIGMPNIPQQAATVEDKPKTVVLEAHAVPKETINADNRMPTWNARVRVKKFAFNGSFNIHLFIGYIKNDQPERFHTKKNEVGFTGVFASGSGDPGSCSNCDNQRDAGFIYQDTIPITPLLVDYLKTNTKTDGPEMNLRTLENFSEAQVTEFLKKNLGWRVTDTKSTLINDQQELIRSGLEIGVSVREYSPPTPQEPLGVYYPSVFVEEITRDKVGGLGFQAPAAHA